MEKEKEKKNKNKKKKKGNFWQKAFAYFMLAVMLFSIITIAFSVLAN